MGFSHSLLPLFMVASVSSGFQTTVSLLQFHGRNVGVTSLNLGLKDQEVSYFSPTVWEETPISSRSIATKELPIMPLGIVKCPNGNCPLHIFEMRYRQLFNNIAKEENKFGVLMLHPETRQIAEIGTIVEVVERSLLPDGRQLVVGVGRERFRMLTALKEKPYLPNITDIGPSDEAEEDAIIQSEYLVWNLLQDVVRLSNKVYNNSKVTVSEDVRRWAPKVGNEKVPGRSTAFSFAVTEMLEVPLIAKQLMLQTVNIEERLQCQAELLDRAQKLLAAQASIKDVLG